MGEKAGVAFEFPVPGSKDAVRERTSDSMYPAVSGKSMETGRSVERAAIFLPWVARL